MATYTNEVLVLASAATQLDAGTEVKTRSGIEIQNLGPNPIYVAVGASTAAVVLKARRLDTYESISMALDKAIKVYAIAVTADQVTTGATIVTEIP